MAPKTLDKILVMQKHWLNLVMSGKKVLEIRSKRLSPGNYWLGCKGEIYAKVILSSPIEVKTLAEWIALRSEHCVQTDVLPYKKTYGLRIVSFGRLAKKYPYKHPRGAIGVVRYRPS